MSDKSKMDQLRELLTMSKGNKGGLIVPQSSQLTGQQMLQGLADMKAATYAQDAEEQKQRQRLETLQRMDQLTRQQRQVMQSIHTGLSDILKGFSPTALAKVIARDAELTDLITKALFLVPAFTPEKTDDRPAGS